MAQRTLVPDAGEVILESVQGEGCGRLRMVLRAARESGFCPRCGRPSYRVHSHYQRRPSDLPWEGLPVRIQLNVRRFFCDGADCGQRIFTERLPKTVERYSRRTCRLNAVLVEMALALGGTAASRLARQLGILASDSTFLRQLRRKGVAISARAPRVLGIDDWAWRKGHRYGTILCDLERGKVIDLLPDRSEESTERWLHEHPGAEIVSRDRASLYAEAATKAAPQAVQVADRWHLLHNLTESLSDALVPYHRLLTGAAGATAAKREVSAAQPGIVQPLSRSQSLQQQRRERRLSRYGAVTELLRQGVSQSEAARHCGLGRKTVRRWIRAGEFPERKPVARATAVDAYREVLEHRWQQGCHNAAQLWRELREQGFTGRPSTVRNWIGRRSGLRRGGAKTPSASPAPPRASPRQTAWLLLKEPEEARPYLEELCRRSPEIATCASLAREFCRMIRQRDAAAWPKWREDAKTSLLANFAKHLCRDEAALLAAMQQPWSNGPVEGNVHRLKLIKRSMYGRANFDLLRLRVVHAA